MIATGSRDGTVRIWQIEPPPSDEEYGITRREIWKSEIVAEFGKGGARVAMVDVRENRVPTDRELMVYCSGTQLERL